MTARFVIRRHRRPWGTRWTFQLVAANGEPLPDVYETKGAAKRGIEAMRRAAAAAIVVDEVGVIDHGDPRVPDGG